MLELHFDSLKFSFPNVHPNAGCSLNFQRTLRIPDDGKTYPLPPGRGKFPLRHVREFDVKLDDVTRERGGVMLPMYQSEALWVSFEPHHVSNRKGTTSYPVAVKLSAGKRSAVTGKDWSVTLDEGDYLVIPKQPWLDGFVVSKGVIKQFVAAPLGLGFTVEEQLTGKAEFGGIQIEVIPMKAEEFEKRFPKQETRGGYRGASAGGLEGLDGLESTIMSFGSTRSIKSVSASMGMAAGGSMRQEIYADPYGIDVWDQENKERTFVHIFNSLAWESITGSMPPTTPPTAKDYEARGLPWFLHYADGPVVDASPDLANIKSVTQIADDKGFTILPENQSVDINPTHIKATGNPNKVTNGNW